MSDDAWLQRKQGYLRGATLRWKPFAPHPLIPTHAHCEFCWQTFADYGEPPDVLAEGYATAGNTDGFDEDFFREFPRDDYYWICEQCYEQYRDLFQWIVERPKYSPKAP